MKKFLREHGLWVLFAAALISVALALVSYFSAAGSPFSNLAGIVASPFRTAYSAVADWFGQRRAYFSGYQELEQENAALRRQIAEMEQSVRQAQSDSDENARLRELLNLREKRRDLELEPAYITERSSSNWTSSLTLSCGTNRDLAAGDCVITETGDLVGIISEAGTNWATVLTVLDTDTSLGALVFRTSDIGLAQGDISLLVDGKLKLDYLPAGALLLGGDLVVTSGLGGYYPSGLVIGTVDAVQTDEAGSTRYAVLTPAADIAGVTEVFVIKSFDIVD